MPGRTGIPGMTGIPVTVVVRADVD
jgi:hypothetical protein